MSNRAIKLFFPREDETVLNNRLALGMPTLLITTVDSRRSWMIGLDDIVVTDLGIVALQEFEGLGQWSIEMCELVRARRAFSLIDGAVVFYRNIKTWLTADQLNDALFYIESMEPRQADFSTAGTQTDRTLRH